MNTPVTEAIAKTEGVGEVGNAEYFEDAELVKEAEYYQYSPLGGDCIRLVEVLPTEDESIQCELHVCSLNALSTRKGAPYIALSYTWGPWRDRRQITINGKLMYVRNHLWLALQAIKTLKARAKNSRNSKKIRKESASESLIWVDAISINQYDLAERNQQVPLMNIIFSQATSVFVWLGPSSRGSSLAVHHIRGEGRDGNTNKHHGYLLSLLSRAYWKRMWIVQEVLLARDLKFICGNEHFTWDKLHKTLTCHDADQCSCRREKDKFHETLAKTPGAVIASARENYRDHSSPEYIGSLPAEIQLVRMITTWAGQQCSDPYDKVFALLGLLQVRSTRRTKLISVDYGVPLENLYSDVMFTVASSSTLPSGDLRAFCVTLQTSLEVCPSNGTVRDAIEDALSTHEEEKYLPMPLDEFAKKHTVKCTKCWEGMMQSTLLRFDRGRRVLGRGFLGDPEDLELERL